MGEGGESWKGVAEGGGGGLNGLRAGGRSWGQGLGMGDNWERLREGGRGWWRRALAQQCPVWQEAWAASWHAACESGKPPVGNTAALPARSAPRGRAPQVH